MSFIQSPGFEDQFGKLIADNTENQADIASHFDFNVERWRYKRRDATTGGLTREFVQYGETTGFTDGPDSFTIDPTSADFIAQLTTAERYRYSVQYTMTVSFAFETNQLLAAGDKVVIGFGDPDIENNMAGADGWFLEFLPSLAANECYFNMYRNGTIVSNGGSDNLVQLESGITDWRQMAITFNWYNVGSAILQETYTNNGRQKNEEQSEIAAGDARGPETANKRLTASIRGGGNGTTLDFGSIGVITNGQANNITRDKADRGEFTIGTADVWVPLLAIRRDPDRTTVGLSVRNLTILRYTAQEDEVEVQLKNFDETKVSFTGDDSWSTPDHLTPANTSLESREDPDQFADQTGALVSNSTTPGGYQISRTELSPSGEKFQEGARATDAEFIKKGIYNGDIGIIMAKSPVAGETVTFNYAVSENW